MRTPFRYSDEFFFKLFLLLVVLVALAIGIIGMIATQDQYPALPLYGGVGFLFWLVIYRCIC